MTTEGTSSLENHVDSVADVTEPEDAANQADRSAATKEFLHLLHEKEAVKTELVEMEKKFNQAQGRNYELLQKIEQLEKEVKNIFYWSL